MSTHDDTIRPGYGVVIPVGVVEWRFTPSGGPGGQHANKSSTRVEARLDLATAPGLDDATRAKLIGKLGQTVTVGVDDSRSQHRNRQVAIERLAAVLAGALRTRRRRRATRPSRGAVRRRLKDKRAQSEKKARRRRVEYDD